jgi:hypothetical protein
MGNLPFCYVSRTVADAPWALLDPKAEFGEVSADTAADAGTHTQKFRPLISGERKHGTATKEAESISHTSVNEQ